MWTITTPPPPGNHGDLAFQGWYIQKTFGVVFIAGKNFDCFKVWYFCRFDFLNECYIVFLNSVFVG